MTEKSSLEKRLGTEFYKEYQASRQALKAAIYDLLRRPGTEFTWKSLKESLTLFGGDVHVIRIHYAQLFHQLTAKLIREQRLSVYFKDNQKIFTVLEAQVYVPADAGIDDYRAIFPALKQQFWLIIRRYNKGDIIKAKEILDELDIPGKANTELMARYRNYVHGRMNDLTKAGYFRAPEAAESPDARGRRFVRTALALPDKGLGGI